METNQQEMHRERGWSVEYPTTTVTTGYCKKQSNRDSQQEYEEFAGPKCRYQGPWRCTNSGVTWPKQEGKRGSKQNMLQMSGLAAAAVVVRVSLIK